jgi:hypothetical protein
MMSMRIHGFWLTLLLSLSILGSSSSESYAYLDPGTGSMLLQLLLGGVAGLLVIGKLYWYRFKVFFGLHKPQPDQERSQLVP